MKLLTGAKIQPQVVMEKSCWSQRSSAQEADPGPGPEQESWAPGRTFGSITPLGDRGSVGQGFSSDSCRALIWFSINLCLLMLWAEHKSWRIKQNVKFFPASVMSTFVILLKKEEKWWLKINFSLRPSCFLIDDQLCQVRPSVDVLISFCKLYCKLREGLKNKQQ